MSHSTNDACDLIYETECHSTVMTNLHETRPGALPCYAPVGTEAEHELQNNCDYLNKL